MKKTVTFKRIWCVLKNTNRNFGSYHLPRHSAALSYYTIFAFAPLLVVLIALGSLFFSQDLVQATPPDLLTTLEEPRTLLNAEALDKLREGYAALGPAGDGLYDAAILAMRVSLSDALSMVFFVGFVCTAIGLVVSLFIPESGALRSTWDEPDDTPTTAAAVRANPNPPRAEGEPAG